MPTVACKSLRRLAGARGATGTRGGGRPSGATALLRGTGSPTAAALLCDAGSPTALLAGIAVARTGARWLNILGIAGTAPPDMAAKADMDMPKPGKPPRADASLALTLRATEGPNPGNGGCTNRGIDDWRSNSGKTLGPREGGGVGEGL